jgi:hypothetical protein
VSVSVSLSVSASDSSLPELSLPFVARGREGEKDRGRNAEQCAHLETSGQGGP